MVKLFILLIVAVIGTCVSITIMDAGLKLMIENGIPESVIQAAEGVAVSIAGYLLFVWCIERPSRELYKMIFN